MTTENAFVNLRNTVSGQSKEYTKEEADRILAHPVWGKVNEVVRTAKPEVLSDKEAKGKTASKNDEKEEAE